MTDETPTLVSATGDRPYDLLVRTVIDYAIYMLDLEGRVMSWNAGARAIKGYEEEEILGKHFSQFFTEEDRAAGRPARALENARTKGRHMEEGWRLRKDGTRFWALAALDPIHDDAGVLIGFAKVTRDMTEARMAQEALRQSEQQLRMLIDSVTDYALYMLDLDGRVTNWNTGAERAKGYKRHEIIGEHFSRFYPAEDRAAGVPQLALKTAREAGRFEAEGWRVRKDGTRFWASVVIDPIRDERGELVGYAKITRDMTEKREAQLRLEEAREQLFQSQKMEAIGQMTGGVAHDFNNLLTVVLGGADMARKMAGDNARLKKLLDGIYVSAQRGASLTRQLLAFARRQPLTPTTIDVSQQMESAADLLRHSLGGDVDVVLEAAPDQLQAAEADASQLDLALLNLGLNARDAGAHTLRFSAENAELHGEIEDLFGSFVAISVSDDGSGIPADIINRVFEPFFTTKGIGQGTGLGLSQIYGFCRQSKGAVVVRSKVGEGTKVTLYLPATNALPHEAGAACPVANARSARVVVVEDDRRVAELAAELIREMGHEVEIAHDADEGLKILRERGRFDLVFSDIMMPGDMNGLELASEVRRLYPDVRVVLTTGYSEAAAAGPTDFPLVIKPYHYEELAEALNRSLPQAA